jgi:hypothetical protein
VFCGPGHGTRRSPAPQAGPCFAADKTRRIRCIVEVEALAAEEARLHSLYQSRGLALDLQDMRSNFDSSLGASASIGDLNKRGTLAFNSMSRLSSSRVHHFVPGIVARNGTVAMARPIRKP